MNTDETLHSAEDPAEEKPNLRGLPTWRSVYLLILVVFIAYVALLVALQRVFA